MGLRMLISTPPGSVCLSLLVLAELAGVEEMEEALAVPLLRGVCFPEVATRFSTTDAVAID